MGEKKIMGTKGMFCCCGKDHKGVISCWAFLFFRSQKPLSTSQQRLFHSIQERSHPVSGWAQEQSLVWLLYHFKKEDAWCCHLNSLCGRRMKTVLRWSVRSWDPAQKACEFQELSSSWGLCRHLNFSLSPGPRPEQGCRVWHDPSGRICRHQCSAPCILLSVVAVQGSVYELLLKQGTAGIPVSRDVVTAVSMIYWLCGTWECLRISASHTR